MTAAPLRILVVDDDEVDRMIVRRAFGVAGVAAEMTDAADAEEAWELLSTRTFDCVVCDLAMPGRNGRWLLSNVKASTLGIPVVMLTAHGDEDTAVDLIKAGAADYIPKGKLAADRLARTVLGALRVFRAEQDAREATAALERQVSRLRALAAVATELRVSLSDQEMASVLVDAARKILGTASIELGDRALTAHALHEGTAAALVVPLSVEGRVLGFLRVEPTPERPFDGSDLAVASQLAQLGAIALENARLLRDTARAAAAREETLGVVSHDLRGPLSVIRLVIEALGRAPDAERRTDLSVRAKRAIERMDALIRDLLDIARIDAGKLAVDCARASPAQLVEENVDLVRPLAASKGIVVTIRCAAKLPPIDADAARLGQVFQNLLGNAIKFTPRDGTIVVAAQPTVEAVRFEVNDSGPGIAEDALPHVFERFWRPAGMDRSRDGAGLGLAIARGIVEAHGGSIAVQRGESGGASFSFTIPRSAVSPEVPAKPRSRRDEPDADAERSETAPV